MLRSGYRSSTTQWCPFYSEQLLGLHTGCSKSQSEDWEVRGALQLVLAILRLQAICQQKRSSGNGEGESAPVHDGSLPTLECRKRLVIYRSLGRDSEDVHQRGRKPKWGCIALQVKPACGGVLSKAPREGDSIFKDNADMDRVDSGLKHNIHHNRRALRSLHHEDGDRRIKTAPHRTESSLFCKSTKCSITDGSKQWQRPINDDAHHGPSTGSSIAGKSWSCISWFVVFCIFFKFTVNVDWLLVIGCCVLHFRGHRRIQGAVMTPTRSRRSKSSVTSTEIDLLTRESNLCYIDITQWQVNRMTLKNRKSRSWLPK